MSSFYHSTLKNHQKTPVNEIVGTLSSAYSRQHLDQKRQQTQAWEATTQLIKDFYKAARLHISDLDAWSVIYEYNIPRRAKRIDIVLLSKKLIYVIEIKNRQKTYSAADIAQLEDYCLDLRDFHEGSKDRMIVPIILCTEAKERPNSLSPIEDFVQTVVYANSHNLASLIVKINKQYKSASKNIVHAQWHKSHYAPTPTIIEAAQALYAGQTVEEISRSQAGAKNLTSTTEAVLNAIKDAQDQNKKIICFITGVPGAGKTLAGLNIIHNRSFTSKKKEHGTFLSGNSPLVKVLSEALALDYSKRKNISKNEARRQVKTFVHNVHEFIGAYYFDVKKKPADHLIVYDEAQRAWNKEQKTKKSEGAITESEPEILLSIMNRLPKWGAIIALVGGGQEINTGEAGLREWGRALEAKFTNWTVYISQELKQGDHSTGNQRLFEKAPTKIKVVENKDLHLSTSIRSYKAKDLSAWVAHVLDGENQKAHALLNKRLESYPIFVTRDIEIAKHFLKRRARGTRRVGFVASSGGRRLKAIGYDPFYGLRGDSSQSHLGAWYLNPPNDVRSSNFLEVIATEYAVQGLEIDWAGLLWDADLRRTNQSWGFKQFKGTKWQSVSDDQNQQRQFILNKYRVLLTRAREGIIIYVPVGDEQDETRKPSFYNETFSYLKACGAKEVKDEAH